MPELESLEAKPEESGWAGQGIREAGNQMKAWVSRAEGSPVPAVQTEATATHHSSLSISLTCIQLLRDSSWLSGVWQVLHKELKWEGCVADADGRMRNGVRKGRNGGAGLR